MTAIGWVFIIFGNVFTWTMLAVALNPNPPFNTIPFSIAGVALAVGGLVMITLDD